MDSPYRCAVRIRIDQCVSVSSKLIAGAFRSTGKRCTASAARLPALNTHLAGSGIKATFRPRTRFVTHLDVDAAMIDATVNAFAGFFR